VPERPWTICCNRGARELFVESDSTSFTSRSAGCQEELWPGKQCLNLTAEVVWKPGAFAARVDRRSSAPTPAQEEENGNCPDARIRRLPGIPVSGQRVRPRIL
jgi:hypothetical protein